MQKILIMSTDGETLRDANIGYSCDDGDLMAETIRKRGLQVPVGYAPGMNIPFYATPLHAIGDGWRLLAPPLAYNKDRYEWWFTKD